MFVAMMKMWIEVVGVQWLLLHVKRVAVQIVVLLRVRVGCSIAVMVVGDACQAGVEVEAVLRLDVDLAKSGHLTRFDVVDVDFDLLRCYRPEVS